MIMQKKCWISLTANKNNGECIEIFGWFVAGEKKKHMEANHTKKLTNPI
jgi:hypothetical protein